MNSAFAGSREAMVSPAAPPEPLARGPEVLGISNLAQAGKFFGQKFAAFGRRRKVMRIIHKPVALAWRQRASAALRARAAATLPPAFVNNSHDFYPTREASPKVPTFSCRGRVVVRNTLRTCKNRPSAIKSTRKIHLPAPAWPD